MGKRILFRLLAIALSIVGVVIALEVALRISGVQSDFFFQPDPEVGATLIPGKSGWHVTGSIRQWIDINAHGYRDRERSLAKPAGTFRIAALGDSFVEAFQVSHERTFAQRLEARLRDGCGGGTYEVLNFGVSGFGTGQALETLRRRAAAFDPDLVLLFFYPSNDLYDNSRELDVEPNRLHFALEPSGELVRLPFEVRDNAMKRWLRHHSRAYLFVRDRLKTMAALERALQAVHLVQEQVDPETEASRRALRSLRGGRYRVPPSPALERSWRLTEALIAETRRTAESLRAGFGLVVIPNKEEILDDGPRPEGIEPAAWSYQQSLERAARICERLALPCLSLVEALRASGAAVDRHYIPGDGHWTEEGHALVAAELWPFVRPWACPAGGGDP